MTNNSSYEPSGFELFRDILTGKHHSTALRASDEKPFILDWLGFTLVWLCGLYLLWGLGTFGLPVALAYAATGDGPSAKWLQGQFEWSFRWASMTVIPAGILSAFLAPRWYYNAEMSMLKYFGWTFGISLLINTAVAVLFSFGGGLSLFVTVFVIAFMIGVVAALIVAWLSRVSLIWTAFLSFILAGRMRAICIAILVILVCYTGSYVHLRSRGDFILRERFYSERGAFGGMWYETHIRTGGMWKDMIYWPLAELELLVANPVVEKHGIDSGVFYREQFKAPRRP